MASVNRVTLIGNLGADPEIRYSPSGNAVINFSLATTDQWQDKDGNKQSKTEWHKIVSFGRLAEVCCEYLVKGKQVYCEGKLQTRSWENSEGVKQHTTEVVINVMQMLGSKE